MSMMNNSEYVLALRVLRLEPGGLPMIMTESSFSGATAMKPLGEEA